MLSVTQPSTTCFAEDYDFSYVDYRPT